MYSKRYYFTHPPNYHPITHFHQQTIPKPKHVKHRHYKRYHRRPLNYWAIVKTPDNKIEAYQLSKDIQYAIKFDTPKVAIPQLIGKLIVIPVSKYNQQGQALMSVGQIQYIFQKPHTSNSRWITRGQFTRIWKKPNGKINYKQMANYLRHDYDQQSKENITHAIVKLLTKPNPRKQLTYQNIATTIWFIFSLIISLIYFWHRQILNPASVLLTAFILLVTLIGQYSINQLFCPTK